MAHEDLMMAPVMMVYVTTSSRDEAMQLGRVLVEARLAACAHVLDGMTAIYHWDGKLQEEDEAVLILKTTTDLLESLTARLCELHSYDLPLSSPEKLKRVTRLTSIG